MTPGLHRAVVVSLVVAGAGAAGLTGLAVLNAAARGVGTGMLAAIAVAVATAALGLWAAALRLREHFERLERLRGDLLVAASRDAPLPARWQGPAADEAGRLGQAVAQLIEAHRLRRDAPDARLAAVVAAATEGLVVVTGTGLVSLVNGAALARVGERRAALGTSIYDLFHRSELTLAASQARAAGKPLTTTLHTVLGEALEVRIAELSEAAGLIISLPAGAGEAAVGVHHDLRLHEEPPAPEPITPQSPLDRLPVAVIDTETTGLDMDADRIVSVAAIRLHGSRVFRHLTLDRLVNPGQPIPTRATAVHGISTAMVGGAPSFAEVLPDLAGFLSGLVAVGHCVGFDLGMLERETLRAGAGWKPPPSLCTMRLAAALFGETDQLSLDVITDRLGVSVQGRHTALGDALVTAEVYVRMLPLLAEAGVLTLGDALAFAERPRKVIAQQRAAGW